ncbi:adenine nucleotide alpha hydrolase family protein [Propionispora hippei]|uniref:Electron transfer flavoprotein domain-containing protein n=1 Tax=Propionispora hippei DSM 15287 TaxID=1123003 RepID=A0A1M6KXS4_9FIRM|nr:hypothetical protein [Propionispora hippei]SHJ63672.1 Electron transfer flavoprotein domain-containing protein [Propionispora hippei DSM 15287]
MAGIWIFSEKVEIAKRLITLGTELRQAMGQPLRVFCFEAKTGLEYIDCGADEGMILREYLGYTVSYSQSIIQLALREEPAVILLDDTLRGRDLAMALAVRLPMRLIHDALQAGFDGTDLLVKRKVDGGGMVLTGRQRLPAIITLAVDAYPAAVDTERAGRLIHMPLSSGGRTPLMLPGLMLGALSDK